MNLKELIRPDADMAAKTSNVEWKEGFTFSIRFINRATIRELLDASQVWTFDPDAKKRVQTLDTDKFIRSLSRKMVVGWSGVTLRKLSKLMPLKVEEIKPEDLDTPIDFEYENLQMVLTNCTGLDEFLQNCSQDITLFQSINEEGLRGNSMSSVSTT